PVAIEHNQYTAEIRIRLGRDPADPVQFDSCAERHFKHPRFVKKRQNARNNRLACYTACNDVADLELAELDRILEILAVTHIERSDNGTAAANALSARPHNEKATQPIPILFHRAK